MSKLFKFDGLEEDQAKFILAVLGEKPFNMVAGLIQKLGNQLNAQLNPSAPPVPPEVSPTTKLTDAVKGLPTTLDMLDRVVPVEQTPAPPTLVDALG